MRSKVWREELSIIFNRSEIPFEYQTQSFETPLGKYKPDFVLPGNIIVDVIYRDEEKIGKISSFHYNYDYWDLILVGEEYEGMSCDRFIYFKDVDEISSILIQ